MYGIFTYIYYLYHKNPPNVGRSYMPYMDPMGMLGKFPAFPFTPIGVWHGIKQANSGFGWFQENYKTPVEHTPGNPPMKGIPLWPVGKGLGVCSKGVLKQPQSDWILHGFSSSFSSSCS